MKVIRRIISTIMLAAFVMVAINVPVVNKDVTVKAATLKLSSKSLTLDVGEKKTLKVSGSSQKITWTSSKAKVASVSGSGKVTALSEGKTMITAMVGGKKITCWVTVCEAAPDFTYDAPFEATEVQIGDTRFVMPSDWDISPPLEQSDFTVLSLTPKDAVNGSGVLVYISNVKTANVEYDILRTMLSSVLTKEYFTKSFKETFGDTPFEIKNFTQSDFESVSGKAFKINMSVIAEGVTTQSVMYQRYSNGRLVQIVTTDADNLGLESISDYIIGSAYVR